MIRQRGFSFIQRYVTVTALTRGLFHVKF